VIDVFILNNEFMDKAVQNNLEYIKTETLTHTLHIVNELENGIEVNFDAITTKLLIKKHIK
jgi:isoleucyl-tRNA synthetase